MRLGATIPGPYLELVLHTLSSECSWPRPIALYGLASGTRWRWADEDIHQPWPLGVHAGSFADRPRDVCAVELGSGCDVPHSIVDVENGIAVEMNYVWVLLVDLQRL
jgi:hypothetical protein